MSARVEQVGPVFAVVVGNVVQSHHIRRDEAIAVRDLLNKADVMPVVLDGAPPGFGMADASAVAAEAPSFEVGRCVTAAPGETLELSEGSATTAAQWVSVAVSDKASWVVARVREGAYDHILDELAAADSRKTVQAAIAARREALA